MPHWRLLVVTFLWAFPLLFLVGSGVYFLWDSGLGRWAWWPVTGCMALAFILGWHWQKQRRLLRLDFTPSIHWTDRDRQAWELVQGRATAAAQFGADKLANFNLYIDTARDLALELARFYHPGAKDPVGSLTIPEILAVVELASHDLADMVDRYVPGGHLLTIDAWRKAKQASDWYQSASNLSWLVYSLFAPVETAARFMASQVGVVGPWQKFQQNILVWFYSAYLHRLGTYLIELNSGRLRVGASRYRQLVEQAREPAPTEGKEPADSIRDVTLAVIGQAKAGKSSLINALLGEQRAKVDVLPVTSEITRYVLHAEGIPTRLQVLDTVGYGLAGSAESQAKANAEAARQSDLVLLVLHARNPARLVDVAFLQKLREYFEANPGLKMPPILGVLTHIDLLSPMLEWQPPYDWQHPQRPKEQQVAEALTAVREQLGDYLNGALPVCTEADKVYGVDDWLLPAISELLDQARAVALLRCLKNEADAGKIRKVLQQLLAAGKEAAKVLWQVSRKK